MFFRACLILTITVVLQSGGAAQELCNAVPLGVQVLGSGGPFTSTSRASSGYLVWREGRAVVMVDVGGGTAVRFGEAGARLADLSLLAISHLHPDHVSDLPALMWLSDLVRQRPLSVAGPSAGRQFPSIDTFITRLFSSNVGAFPILSGALHQTGRGIPLDVVVVDVAAIDQTTVLNEDDLHVTAIGVPHGPVDVPEASVPSVAYRVQVGERSVVFSSDQNGMDERFVSFSMGVDVLVMHFAVSTEATEARRQLHATPAIVGQIARDAQVGRLILSHVTEPPAEVPQRESFSGPRLDQNVAVVREIFSGPIVVAEDLKCVVVQ